MYLKSLPLPKATQTISTGLHKDDMTECSYKDDKTTSESTVSTNTVTAPFCTASMTWRQIRVSLLLSVQHPWRGDRFECHCSFLYSIHDVETDSSVTAPFCTASMTWRQIRVSLLLSVQHPWRGDRFECHCSFLYSIHDVETDSVTAPFCTASMTWRQIRVWASSRSHGVVGCPVPTDLTVSPEHTNPSKSDQNEHCFGDFNIWFIESVIVARRLCFHRRWFVLSVCKITQTVVDGFWWNFLKMSEMPWGTTDQILVALHGLFVCLLAYYSKTYEWISMKFSGKIEDGTSNKALNFGSDPWPWRRFALSEFTPRAKVWALRVLLVYYWTHIHKLWVAMYIHLFQWHCQHSSQLHPQSRSRTILSFFFFQFLEEEVMEIWREFCLWSNLSPYTNSSLFSSSFFRLPTGYSSHTVTPFACCIWTLIA